MKVNAKGGLMKYVATYLNEHLTGEVLTHEAVIAGVEQDGGVLTRRPEMVARVAHVNDIRKIMRFCSQLAEKRACVAGVGARLRYGCDGWCNGHWGDDRSDKAYAPYRRD